MKLLKDAAIILTLATLWFCSAYFAIYALFPFWALQCALITLIIGLLAIALTNRSEAGSRLLYEGESNTEELTGAKMVIWILIGMPVICTCLGTLWSLMRWLGLFDF